jgi:hypothetical protein
MPSSPAAHPTPCRFDGLRAHHCGAFGAQAIVPSKLTQDSPSGQSTPAGHSCWSHRKPGGHEGSCDAALFNREGPW